MSSFEFARDWPCIAYGLFFSGFTLAGFILDETTRVRFNQALTALVLLATLTALKQTGLAMQRVAHSKLALWFVGLTLLSAASSIRLELPAEKIGQVSLVVAIAFVGVPVVLRDSSRIRVFSLSVLAINFGAALIAIINAQVSQPRRIGLTEGGGPIVAGRAAGLALVLILAYLPFARRRFVSYWVFSPLSAVMLGTVLVRSASQGPILGVMAAIVIPATVFRIRSLTSPIRRRTAGVILLVTVFLLERVGQIRVPGRLRRPLVDDEARADLARDAIGLASEPAGLNPLGRGIGSFGPSAGRGAGSYPHNIFLEVLVETGWPAALVFAVIVASSIRNTFRVGGRTSALVRSGLLFSLVNAMVSANVVGNRLLFAWVAIAISGVFADMTKQRVTSVRSGDQVHPASG